jgi:tetratricopeptide (TPR) repeat protein
MQFRSTRLVVAIALTVSAAIGASSCGRYSLSNFRAMKAYKDANELYKKNDFRGAAAGYEEVLRLNPDFFGSTYFFLGNSYENMYKPAHKGEAENDGYLTKAAANYELAVQKTKPTDPDGQKYRIYSYQYLIEVNGKDKLNDVNKAEAFAQALIKEDPNEPTSHLALGKLYEDAGRYEEAEVEFKKAIDVRPNDAALYASLAGFYNRKGDFEKTMEAWTMRAKQEPNNPEAWQTIASYYQEKAYKDTTLPPAKAKQYTMLGLEAVDKALALNPKYFEALSYKNILLRQQARFEKDPKVQKQLMDQADEFYKKAMDAQKNQKGK